MDLGATCSINSNCIDVSLLHLTAQLFNALVPDDYRGLAGIKQLLTGGDVVSSSQVRNALTASDRSSRDALLRTDRSDDVQRDVLG